jgi:DNA-binding transcriptional LysR family regulator
MDYVRLVAAYDLISLDLLLDIADAGTLTGGAARSLMGASAASQRIAKLEAAVGQPLLERLPRGIRVTEAGQVLVDRTRIIRRELRSATGELEAIRGLERGEVRLGSFPTVSASVLSDALKIAAARWPAVKVVVHSALRPSLLDMLQEGDIEMALLWSYPWTEEAEKSLDLRPIMDDETLLLVAADSPLRDGVRLSDLVDEPWITRGNEHPASDVLRRSAPAMGSTPRVVYRANDYLEVQAMVAAGVGVAMVPRIALDHHRPDVKALAFHPQDRVPSRIVYLATLARRAYTPAMRAVADAVSEAVSERIAAAAATPTAQALRADGSPG